MPQQFVILIIFAVVAGLLATGFVLSALQARKGPEDYHEIHDKGYRIRRYWFIFLIVVVVGGLGATLPHLPYPMVQKPSAATPVTTVDVTAMQFGWQMSLAGGDRLETLRTHDHIRFRVTSDDVNHGFMIEDPKGNIIGQVQAMPEVTNDLYFTFDEPGTYTIRCGELCGLYHTDMLGQIVVEDGGADHG